MKILIEGHNYHADKVERYLDGLQPLANVHGEVSVGYVGYFYNENLKDCIFILPKVLLNEQNRIFVSETRPEGFDPVEIIDFDNNKHLTETERQFIYEFAVWIYRSIVVYNNDHPDNDIIYAKKLTEAGRGRKHKSRTFLDILITIVYFNRENQNFFMQVLRNQHKGLNKINWPKTVTRSPAVIDRDTPVYISPINRKRQINFDEELLVIFFSILNYINETYGFPVRLNLGYDLIKGPHFKQLMGGQGLRRLRQIKYKYFSDKALQIWELCYAFFSRAAVQVSSHIQEYLLAKNFEIVFEGIINTLIGDNDVPDKLINQRDGKIVDHIFTHRGLTTHEEDKKIYYIGDSKYYKIGNQVTGESVYKQYTYARNLVQWNLDLFNNPDSRDSRRYRDRHRPYRDDRTEGYNIIPNFFISAKLTDGLKYTDHVEPRKKPFIQRQFKNRLFDRDTLLISHYDVNFLFIISLYARNNAGQRTAWRDSVREMFRREIQRMLSENFSFYAITPHEDVNADNYISENFQKLLGKIFKPYEDAGEQQYFSLALRKPESAESPRVREELEAENESTRQIIDQYFYRAECPLGVDPRSLDDLPKVTPKKIEFVPKEFRTRYFFEAYGETVFLVGGYKNNEHLNWIFGRQGKRDNMYNIRVTRQRDGAISKSAAIKRHPDFLFLYNIEKPTADGLMTFRIHNAADTPHDFMVKTGYPNPTGNYVSYVLEPDPITFGDIDIARMIEDYKAANPDYKSGAPIFMKGRDIIKYRLNCG